MAKRASRIVQARLPYRPSEPLASSKQASRIVQASLAHRPGKPSRIVQASLPRKRGEICQLALVRKHIVGMRFGRRDAAAFSTPDQQRIRLTVTNIEVSCREIAHDAGRAAF